MSIRDNWFTLISSSFLEHSCQNERKIKDDHRLVYTFWIERTEKNNSRWWWWFWISGWYFRYLLGKDFLPLSPTSSVLLDNFHGNRINVSLQNQWVKKINFTNKCVCVCGGGGCDGCVELLLLSSSLSMAMNVDEWKSKKMTCVGVWEYWIFFWFSCFFLDNFSTKW